MKKYVVSIGATFRAYGEIKLSGASEDEVRERVQKELERIHQELDSPFGVTFQLDSTTGGDFYLVHLEEVGSGSQAR